MGQATVYLDDDISVCDVEDYTLQSGAVTVAISPEGWWRLIEALQDWLGECPHCEKKVGEPTEFQLAKRVALAKATDARDDKTGPGNTKSPVIPDGPGGGGK